MTSFGKLHSSEALCFVLSVEMRMQLVGSGSVVNRGRIDCKQFESPGRKFVVVDHCSK